MVAAGQETTLEQRARCRLAAVYAADSAVTLAPEWYPIGGRVYLGMARARACARPLGGELGGLQVVLPREVAPSTPA